MKSNIGIFGRIVAILLALFVIHIMFLSNSNTVSTIKESTIAENLSSEYLQRINYIRNEHFKEYPESMGYENIDTAFSGFFGRPNWNATESRVIFKGIMEVNGKKTLTKIIFYLDKITNFNNLKVEEIYFNDRKVYAVYNSYSLVVPGDILAAIYLNN